MDTKTATREAIALRDDTKALLRAHDKNIEGLLRTLARETGVPFMREYQVR